MMNMWWYRFKRDNIPWSKPYKLRVSEWKRLMQQHESIKRNQDFFRLFGDEAK